jgi:hypothetical protein
LPLSSKFLQKFLTAGLLRLATIAGKNNALRSFAEPILDK